MTSQPSSGPKKDAEAYGKVDMIDDIHGVVLYQGDGHIQRLPVPSSDPNDPLNFSGWRQHLILASVIMYGIAAFGVVQSTPLFFSRLIGDYEAKTHGVSITTFLH